MDKIKVLYTPLNGKKIDGLSIIEFRLGTNMNKEKVSVDFFSTYKITDDFYKKVAERQNGKIYDFDINSQKSKIKKKMLVIKEFNSVLKKNNYDIVHIHIDNSYTGFLYGFIAKKAGIGKIIFHSHNTAIIGKIKNILHIIFKPTLKFLGDEYLTCSTEVAKWMYTKSILRNKKIKMIENGIAIEKYILIKI